LQINLDIRIDFRIFTNKYGYYGKDRTIDER
jgi:hypothetical protein